MRGVDMKKTFRLSKRLAAIAAAAILIFAYTAAPAFAYSDYTTDRYDVAVNVTKAHVFQMTEKIKVDFQGEHHGIYRYIPQNASNYSIKNISVSYKNDDGESRDDCSVETNAGNGDNYTMIQIGSADEYLLGVHTFTVKYDLVCNEDSSTAKDFFSLDLLPTSWETAIGASNITVTMPTAVDWSGFKLYAGSYGSKALNENVKFTYSGKTATIKAKSLDQGVGITMEASLPQGYWVGAVSHQGAKVPLVGIMIIIPLIMLIMWLIFGRDPKFAKTVEFYPPDGMSPAELGYVVDGALDHKDMASLIMYYASKGYIRIEQSEHGDYTAVKLKEPDGTEKKYLKTFFKGIFSDGTEVPLDKMPETFGDDYSVAVDQLKGAYSGEKKLFSTASLTCKIIGLLLMAVLAIVSTGLAGYIEYQTEVAVITIPLILCMLVGIGLITSAFARAYSSKKSKTGAMYIAGVIITGLNILLTGGVMFVMTDKLSYTLAIIASLAVTGFMAIIMGARTKYSMELRQKILGFRDFVKNAEVEKLEALAGQDPDYFFNIMPYAYVMGLSDKWAKQFANIKVPAPSWYYGNNAGDMIFTTMWYSSMMNSCSRSMASGISSATGIKIDSSDTGGGFGGGGFGGGGGFSGGGFGGGGGGAW